MDLRIEHEPDERGGALRAFDDEGAIGSTVYVRSGPTTVVVQHTGVEPRGRGQGIGQALFHALVEWARESGTKITPQCPYMLKQFRKHPETKDVLR